jgi:hypothetical protein
MTTAPAAETSTAVPRLPDPRTAVVTGPEVRRVSAG